MKKYLQFFINFFFNYLPFIFICYIFSSLILINLIALIKETELIKEYLIFIHLSIFIISIFFLRKLKKVIFREKINLSIFNFSLLFLGLIIVIYRSIIYFHAIDDFVHHMITGYYAYDIWVTKNFFATPTVYWFPLMQISFYPLLEFIGIRLTLFFLNLIQLIWFLNLNYRFNIKINKSKSFFYVNLFFIFLYFLPELIITHGTFMSDFYTVLFALETFYFFYFSKDKIFAYILAFITILTKQSTGFFTLPILIYLSFKNLKNINKKQILFLFLIISSFYFFRSYIELRNPLGLLYNNIFKSPLGDYITPKQADSRFGPLNLIELFYWPFLRYFTSRNIEFLTLNKFTFLVYPLFTFIPYTYGIIKSFKTKKFIYFLFTISFFIWGWISGNGRYQIAMTSLMWIFILKEEFKNNSFNNILLSNIILIFFSLLFFSTIWNDYAWRPFILNKFFPPKVNSYFLNLTKESFKYIGKDRYIDFFNSLKKNPINYDAIILYNRGVQTYYAFLLNKYLDIPIYNFIEKNKESEIFKNRNKVSKNIINSLEILKNKKRILFLSNKDFYPTEQKSWLFKKYNCNLLERDKLVPQFLHENYFNYVVEYNCQ